MKHLFRGLIAALLLAAPALAQSVGGGSPTYQNWFVVGTPTTSTITNASSAHAFPSTGPTARICNQGATDAFINAQGTSGGVVATTSSSWLKAGTCQNFNLKPFGVQYNHWAGITAAGSTTVYVETGLGSPTAMNSTGGGGSPVTWPASGSVVVSNGTNSPAGLAPVNGSCAVGAGGVWTAGSCSGGVQVFQVQATFSSAQILALFDTPQQVIAAPGAGKLIVVDYATYKGTSDYTQVDGAGLIYGTSGHPADDAYGAPLNPFVSSGFVVGGVISEGATPNLIDVLNNPIVLASIATNPTDGTTPVTVTVQYRVITP